MKTLLLALTLTGVLLCSTGCTGLASVTRQLKDDPAFVTVDVRTLYGSGRLVRDGRAANGNSITADGVTSVQPSTSTPTPPPIIHYIYVTNTVRETAAPPPAPQPRVTNPRRIPGSVAARTNSAARLTPAQRRARTLNPTP
jgi:hypothetical protein